MKNSAFISIGSNLGNRRDHLSRALEGLAAMGLVKRVSSVVESPAWGYEDPRPYLNLVVELSTNFGYRDLMAGLLQIEREGGRKRADTPHYQSRTIDLDILFFNQEVVNQKELSIPHPRLHLRRFVLMPLAEIAPHLIHPIFECTINELLLTCEDPTEVILYDKKT